MCKPIVPVVLIEYRVRVGSIIFYIRSMLSLNLTKYKVLYCLRISTNTADKIKLTERRFSLA